MRLHSCFYIKIQGPVGYVVTVHDGISFSGLDGCQLEVGIGCF